MLSVLNSVLYQLCVETLVRDYPSGGNNFEEIAQLVACGCRFRNSCDDYNDNNNNICMNAENNTINTQLLTVEIKLVLTMCLLSITVRKSINLRSAELCRQYTSWVCLSES